MTLVSATGPCVLHLHKISPLHQRSCGLVLPCFGNTALIPVSTSLFIFLHEDCVMEISSLRNFLPLLIQLATSVVKFHDSILHNYVGKLCSS